jgi:hypothetical protein
MTKPAVPPKVHFSMFFQKADGTPLGQTAYQLTWGSGKPVTGQTTQEGWVDEELDGHAGEGYVVFGDGDPKTPAFVPRVTVPIVRILPPAPPKKHKRPGTLLKPKGDPAPDPQPPPTPSEPLPPRPPPGLISMPLPGAGAKPDDPDRGPPPAVFSQNAPAASPDPLDALDRTAAAYHDKWVRIFNIAWKLHNLGFIGWTARPIFPLDGTKYEDLLRALDRYTFRYGLKRILPADLLGTDDTLAEVWAHLRKIHDVLPPQ